MRQDGRRIKNIIKLFTGRAKGARAGDGCRWADVRMKRNNFLRNQQAHSFRMNKIVCLVDDRDLVLERNNE